MTPLFRRKTPRERWPVHAERARAFGIPEELVDAAVSHVVSRQYHWKDRSTFPDGAHLLVEWCVLSGFEPPPELIAYTETEPFAYEVPRRPSRRDAWSEYYDDVDEWEDMDDFA